MAKLVQVAPVLEGKDVKESAIGRNSASAPGASQAIRRASASCGGTMFRCSSISRASRRSRPSINIGQPISTSVDRLADEFAARGVAIIRGPVDQPYGCREIDVRDPDGHIVGFGQNRASAAGMLTRG